MVPALVRLFTGVCALVDRECASLNEALATVGKVAIVGSLISMDPVVSCQVRFAIEPLLRHDWELAVSAVSAVPAVSAVRHNDEG